jgi:hypothetical protein
MNTVQFSMSQRKHPGGMRAHEWVKVDDPSGGPTIEECIKCGIKCIIDPEMPGIRWDYKVFPRIRVNVEYDCASSMVRKIMEN